MYTYAFLANSQPLELPEGIWGSLELVQTESLAALVEPDLPAESLQQADRQLMQAVLSHDRIIQEVFQQATVLPLRFGTYFISRQGLVDHLKSHQQDYLTKLAQLSGKAEYTLKLTPTPFPENPIAADSKGKEYFLAKKRLYQQQADWQQQQQSDLEALIAQASADYPIRQGEAETHPKLYLLSDQQREIELQQQLSRWQQQCSTWELVLSEALPPYHFV
ncbi:MAG: GvpL/GvpF family gas vesicle protein [Pegethrix bostrychoides GSE-TBD4-15B]|jgi:hypothetical protein|uniref:GvpL/GvpF family gas vesicle protein n=1 Tax=Pegethrix bostrychoides GSE-TBD4-15B TaxID=2839662 RepID=A0A951U7D2_9CYAN|nr:GvpL/GvpF family gas vesicle protein [Pegethrix bostrychoides GSE-TBD4-15B]